MKGVTSSDELLDNYHLKGLLKFCFSIFQLVLVPQQQQATVLAKSLKKPSSKNETHTISE